MADGYLCRVCLKVVGATKNNRYRSHKAESGDSCEMSSLEIPQYLLAQAPSDTKQAGVPEEGKDYAKCPQCGRNVTLTRLGYFPPHNKTLYGGDQCETAGVRAKHAGVPKDVPLPGDQIPEAGVNRALRPKVSNQMEVEQSKPKGVPLALPPGVSDLHRAGTVPAELTRAVEAAAPVSADVSQKNLAAQPQALTEEINAQWDQVEAQASALRAAASGASTETNSPESATISDSSSPPTLGPFKLGTTFPGRVSQPDSPFLQPPPWLGTEKPEPMGDLAKELATRVRETFYAYDNRKSVDNRSAQTTLGPSEIGTPCDRRLAMALMGVPAVNPGGDGWAAFVGTMGHVGMGEVYAFADAGTGRYAVELPLVFPSVYVPRGTTDLLDRRDGTILDWKFMGAYSLKKFKLEGPSDTYRVQAHTYGLGAHLSGEVVKNVAIVGLPRAGGSLDDMHVWTERFDRKVGEAALKRVEGIATQVESKRQYDTENVMEVAKSFPTAVDCRYCPFHLKGDKEMRRGCTGV